MILLLMHLTMFQQGNFFVISKYASMYNLFFLHFTATVYSYEHDETIEKESMKFFFFSILDVSNVIQICENCFVLSSHLLFSLQACHTQCCLEYLMFFNELSMLPILSPSLFFYLPPLDYFLFPLLDYSSVK